MQKNLKILVIVFVILSALLAFKQLSPTLFVKRSLYEEKIKTIKKESIKNINIRKDSQELKLVKEGEVWKVEGKKANKDKINNFLEALFPTITPELISQSENRHEEFELTQSLGTFVFLDDRLGFVIGKPAAGGGLYAKFDKDNNVFILKDLDSYNFSTSSSYWVDKTIFSIERSKLKKLTFNKNGQTITMVNKDNKWLEEKSNKEPDKDKFESILITLSSFVANDLWDAKNTKIYPVTPQLELMIDYDGGNEKISFYKGKEDTKVNRASDKEEFIISNTSAEKFLEFNP